MRHLDNEPKKSKWTRSIGPRHGTPTVVLSHTHCSSYSGCINHKSVRTWKRHVEDETRGTSPFTWPWCVHHPGVPRKEFCDAGVKLPNLLSLVAP